MDRALSFRTRLDDDVDDQPDAVAVRTAGPDGDGITVIAAPGSPPTVEARRSAPTAKARREYAFLYACMAVTDSLSFTVALFIAARAQLGDVPVMALPIVVVAPVVVAVLFSWVRLYQSHLFSPAEEFRRLLIGVALASLGLVTISFWAHLPYSRLWVALSWLLATLLTLGSRRFWHWAIARERRRGRFTFRTGIVGANGEATRLASVLGRPHLGFRPIGFVAVESAEPPTGLPVLGSLASLRDVVRIHALDALFVATTAVGANEIAKIQKVARREGIDVHVTANLPELLASRLSVEPLGGVMALSLRPVRLSGAQAAAKRAFDLVLGSVVLLVTLPVWLVVAAAIKLTSRGPVLFRQERVGQRGKRFTLLKFRTMVVDAEAMLVQLRGRNEASGPLFKLRDDPRITPAGRWLRRLSIDELPQLLNVLRGEMSLVGPRPPLQSEVDAYEDWQGDRLEVRPGITGLWQVSGRSDLPFDEYVRLDLFYIENWSLAFDLYILAKTLPAAASTKGAR
jgi:exopolysaccharide biosynthesis polyprenyl glycosylphosphotransferase